MQYCNITTDAELKDYCRDLEHCPAIHFDTEFVSEHTFRPVLCLVQVAAGGALAIIDPLSIEDMTPFWEVLIKPGHETIVHAGRGEVEFCMHAVGENASWSLRCADCGSLRWDRVSGRLCHSLIKNSWGKNRRNTKRGPIGGIAL